MRWGGRGKTRKGGCGLKIKYTIILLPSNLVVPVGTFLCQICPLSFSFSFWVESAHRNEITHHPRILRDQITIWQAEAEWDRGKTWQCATSKAREWGTWTTAHTWAVMNLQRGFICYSHPFLGFSWICLHMSLSIFFFALFTSTLLLGQ